MSAAPKTRVFVADDHPAYRDGLVRALKHRPEFELVGEASEGREALERIRQLSPDVAVLDLRMPGLDGLALLNALRRDGLETPVVFLTGYSSSEMVYRGLAGGASGCLSKTAGTDSILDAVGAVMRGETVVSPEFQGGLVQEIRSREVEDRPVLSEREREVLSETADGHSAAEIGDRLHLSVATVRTHLQHAYAKLNVSDRAAAVREAMRRGLIE